MEFVQNFPFMTIILSLFSGPLSSVLDGKKAKRLNLAVISLIGMMSAAVLGYVLKTGEPYVYLMGHFPAPWGNEIRVGYLEAFMALFFCVIMLLKATHLRGVVIDNEGDIHSLYLPSSSGRDRGGAARSSRDPSCGRDGH